MSGLLVSVRDAREAELALAGGADLIDIKEPRLGSLGPAEVTVWRDIVHVVDGRRPLSVALGELQMHPVADLAPHAIGMAFAKIGLAGCHALQDWPNRWREALNALPHGVARVAVVYADRAAEAPDPARIIDLATEFNCSAVLFDTFVKTRGDLFAHLLLPELLSLVKLIRERGLQVVLGGSLQSDSIARALTVHPDFVAVRGAVCLGSREGSVDEHLVSQLARVLRDSLPVSHAQERIR